MSSSAIYSRLSNYLFLILSKPCYSFSNSH